jgi:hypothetical protein
VKLEISDEQRLAEVDSVLAAMPEYDAFYYAQQPAFIWLGRAGAALEGLLDMADQSQLSQYVRAIEAGTFLNIKRDEGKKGLVRLLHKVRYRLLLRTGRTGTVAIEKGRHFEYFDWVRDKVAAATSEVFLWTRFSMKRC